MAVNTIDSSPDPSGLALLFHHRWNVPVLAALYKAGPGMRFHVIVRQLGVSRDSLRTTLGALIEAGFVMRNPGYGHPLRPEYVLTESGRTLGPCACRFLAAAGCRSFAFRKWTAAVLVAVASSHGRFNALRSRLPLVTPRALTDTLRRCVDEALLAREVDDGYPPRSSYRLTPEAAELGDAAAALAEALG